MVSEQLDQPPPPRVAMPPGRLGRGVAERIDHGDEPPAGRPPLLQERAVAGDRRGAAEPGQVPGLGRGHEGDRVAGFVVVEACEGHVPRAAVVLVQEQVRPDLVADHREVMPRRELGDPQEFPFAKHRAGGIVGMAEPEELGRGRDGRVEPLPVDRPLARCLRQRHADALATGEARQGEKRWIHRREGDDPGAGLGQEPRGDRQAVDHARCARHPLRVDLPAMPPLEVLGERSGEPRRHVGVAEHAVVHPRADRVEHHLGRREIHVGHPGRDHVAAGPAVPLLAAGAAAVGGGGEERIWLWI